MSFGHQNTFDTPREGHMSFSEATFRLALGIGVAGGLLATLIMIATS